MELCQMCDQPIRMSVFFRSWVHHSTADYKCQGTHSVATPHERIV